MPIWSVPSEAISSFSSLYCADKSSIWDTYKETPERERGNDYKSKKCEILVHVWAIHCIIVQHLLLNFLKMSNGQIYFLLHSTLDTFPLKNFLEILSPTDDVIDLRKKCSKRKRKTFFQQNWVSRGWANENLFLRRWKRVLRRRRVKARADILWARASRPARSAASTRRGEMILHEGRRRDWGRQKFCDAHGQGRACRARTRKHWHTRVHTHARTRTHTRTHTYGLARRLFWAPSNNNVFLLLQVLILRMPWNCFLQ